MVIKQEIGYVENFIGADKVVLWFYRRSLGTWRIAHRQTVTISGRAEKLAELIEKCRLVELGLGT